MQKQIARSIGFWWYRTFDVSGLLFVIFKSLPSVFRYTSYILMIVSMFYFAKFVAVPILDWVETIFNIDGFVQKESLTTVNNFVIYSLVFIVSLVVSYEAIFEEKMDGYIALRNEQKMQIREKKKQWWRLRNQHGFIRLLFYTFFSYVIVSFYVYISSIVAISTLHSVIEAREFSHYFLYYLKLILLSCLVLFLTLEYFVVKTIKRGAK
ncbi:MAG: hypothetical protein RBT59_08825 [Arcobacteraceae bacterium]|jgi:hypothetical protein|nr:hypothetical protein [Arcobacteraceae bacterium]